MKTQVSVHYPDYILSAADRSVLEAFDAMLGRLANAGFLGAAHRSLVERAIGALRLVPQVSTDSLSITVNGPRRKAGTSWEFHHWQLNLGRGHMEISSGGYFWRPETGGDSFTSFEWDASPGRRPMWADFRHELWVLGTPIPAFEVHVGTVDFGTRGYSIELSDRRST